LREGEFLHISPEDGRLYQVEDGEMVCARSRRGSIPVPVRYDTGLRPGLAFMSLHFPDDVPTNVLTIDATDPKSGTAEFKASAIRIDKLDVPAAATAG
jgi:formate dehydrogenase major subunit